MRSVTVTVQVGERNISRLLLTSHPPLQHRQLKEEKYPEHVVGREEREGSEVITTADYNHGKQPKSVPTEKSDCVEKP